MRDIDFKKTIFFLTNCFVEEHNKAALEAFPGSVVNLYSSRPGESHSYFTDCQGNPIRDYFVPEITYTFYQACVLLHHMKVKKVALVMVIRSVLHPDIVKGKIFGSSDTPEG